jgi:serine/threonine protein kinase
VSTLSYLRSQHIVHRDLKPANIVLNEHGQLLITDFGTAKKICSSKMSNMSSNSSVSVVSGLSNISAISGIGSKSANISNTSSEYLPNGPADNLPDDFEEIVGSEYFISPEMIESRTYSYASDLWAVGIMLFQFLTGTLPFKGKSQDETFELIKQCQLSVPAEVPEQAADLIRKLIVKTPESRLGAANIDDVKNHKFFEGVNWNSVSFDLPPSKLALTNQQKVLVKYLPHNRKLASSFLNTGAQSSSSELDSSQIQLKKNHSASNLYSQNHLRSENADSHTPAWRTSELRQQINIGAVSATSDLDGDVDSDNNSQNSFYMLAERRYGFNNRILSEDIVTD